MALYPEFFFHDTFRKYTIAFGTMFDSIYVARHDVDGNIVNTERVVCNMTTKQKFFVRTEEDPTADKTIAIKYPRMGYELTNVGYDANRKLQTTGFVSAMAQNPNNANRQYNPVPYNLDFNLYVTAKHQTEGYQIIEQILPFFTPDCPLTINVVPEMCLQTPVPVVLNRIDWDDNYDGTFLERRVMLWTLSFTIQGYFFAPVRPVGVIKTSTINIDSAHGSATITGTPSYNGLPIDQISPEDPWVYSETIIETAEGWNGGTNLSLYQLDSTFNLYQIDAGVDFWYLGV